MLRPLDEALIDFEKTYRQIFKQPLTEHEQYTKRQLIYNYAAVGSEFINKVVHKQGKTKEGKQMDLEEIISQWNNSAVKPEQIMGDQTKNSEGYLTYEEEEEIKNFLKQVEVLKKEKVIVKNRCERNVFFRKELEVLFRARNLNMLSVDSMRSHFGELKPYISYNSRNRIRKDRQGDRFSSRFTDQYRSNQGRNDDARQEYRRYEERQDSRKMQNRQNQRKNDYYGKESQRRDELKDSGKKSDELRESSRKEDSFERQPENFYPVKNPSSYYNPQQYNAPVTPYPNSQFTRSDMAYSKYASSIQISSGHNQNYQANSYEQRVIYPPPPGSKPNSFYQYEPGVNSQYGSYRINQSDGQRHYQNQ